MLRKILQENSRQNPPKCIPQKSPTHFCRGAGPRTADDAATQIASLKRFAAAGGRPLRDEVRLPTKDQRRDSIGVRDGQFLFINQRRRDNNENEMCVFEGVGNWGQRGQLFQNTVFFLFLWEMPRDEKFASPTFMIRNLKGSVQSPNKIEALLRGF